MKKNKLFAPFLMLLAGAVVSLTMFCFHYSAGEALPVVLAVLIIFYLAGCFIQAKVNSFINQINEEKVREEEALERERQAALESAKNTADKAQEDAGSNGEGQA